jgi:choline kinase
VKAVILAAGMSSRLRPLTNDRPKCLLPVAGVPILRRSLAALRSLGVREIVMVLGYLEEKIRDAVREWFPDLAVEYVVAPDYAATQNGASLLAARPAIEGQAFLLLDGDIVFDAGVVEALLASEHEDCLALRPADDLGDEEVKVITDATGKVLRIHVSLPPQDAAGESIGVERFSAATSRVLFQTLEDRIAQHGPRYEYYEKSFDELCTRGVLAMYAVDVGQHYCCEIDTHEDLAAVERALTMRERAS